MNKRSEKVTRVIPAAAHSALRPVALLTLGAVLILNLAACGSNSTNTNAELNQPLTNAQPATKPVAIASIIGAPADVSAKLSDKLAASAKGKNVNIVPAANAEFTVNGFLVAAPDKKGTKLSYIWDVADKAGKRVKRIKGDEIVEKKNAGDPWGAIDDAALEKVAGLTATELHAWLAPPAAPAAGVPVAGAKPATEPAVTSSTAALTQANPAAEKPKAVKAAVQAKPESPAGPAIVVVTPVTGAPGDGQTSLANAMKKHLASRGVKVSDSQAAGAYSVRGVVEMGPAADGQQPITIRWLVIDPSGKQLSNAVVQRNKVEQGSLDAAWGQVADIAAGAAAAELAKIVPKSAS